MKYISINSSSVSTKVDCLLAFTRDHIPFALLTPGTSSEVQNTDWDTILRAVNLQIREGAFSTAASVLPLLEKRISVPLSCART
jgi:hypothetical protein